MLHKRKKGGHKIIAGIICGRLWQANNFCIEKKKKNLEEIDQDSTLYLPNSLECVCLLYFPKMSITHMPLLPIF